MKISNIFKFRQNNRHLFFSMILMASFAAKGASQASAEQQILDRSINKAISDLKAATSMETATLALDGIHRVAARYKQDKALQAKASLCKSLEVLSEIDLALIENSVNEISKSGHIADCEKELKSRLEAHWDLQKATLGIGLDAMGSRAQAQLFKIVERFIDQTNISSYNVYDYQPKQITLTFDDGPDTSITPSVLETLRNYGAKAVFFEIGMHAQDYPEMSRKVVEEGHSLGSHTYSHRDKGLANIQKDEGLFYAQNEVLLGHRAVLGAAGIIKPFFRFPYGAQTPELKTWMHENGIETFLWSIDTLDWKTPDVPTLIANTKTYIQQAGNKGVLLMHDVHQQSALALPSILNYLQSEGYEIILPVAKDQFR